MTTHKITNRGAEIAYTDYWSTPHARRGLLYLSVNAGAVRLLIPPTAPRELHDVLRATTRITIGLAGTASDASASISPSACRAIYR